MAGGVQTIPRVLLGEALKQLREEADVTLDAAAAAVGKDRPRLVKVLDGRATLSSAELESLMNFLEAGDTTRTELRSLGTEARKRATGSPYMDLAPGSFRRIAWLEAIARDVWIYEKGMFPYPIQSQEYIEAVMRAGEGVWWEEPWTVRSNLVTFRMERQKIIFETDPPKRVELMFTSDALYANVGGSEVMRGQIEHVLSMIDRYPNLTVRVVPIDVSGNPAQSGGLIMLRFGDLLRPVGMLPVIYGPSTYFDQTEDTERMLRAFNKLRELALSPQDSRVLLESALKEHW